MKDIKRMWSIKESAEPGSLDLYIYGDVQGDDSYDFVDGEFKRSETSAEYFKDELESRKDITRINLYINSYGGSVFEGTAIYNQLKRHPAHKTVYIDGFACSIASVIAMAGDEIIMPKNTMMMIHNMWMCAVGNAAELRKAADDLDAINAAGRQAYLDKAGNKLEELTLAEMMDKETWLTAEQCVEYGLADRIADREADLTDAGQIIQKLNENLKARIDLHNMLNQLAKPAEPSIGEGKSDPLSAEPKKNKEKKTEPLSLMETLSGFFNAQKEEEKR